MTQITKVAEPRISARRSRAGSGPTIRDVAAECGVSAMTVSAVINNKSGQVGEEKRLRILAAIDRLNYHPVAAARALSSQRTNTIGIVLGVLSAGEAITTPYMGGVIQGVLLEAAKYSQDIHLVNRRWHSKEQSANAFRDQRCDGYVLIAPTMGSDIVEGLQLTEKPLVVVAGDANQQGVVSVGNDDRAAAVNTVRYFYALGHRAIAHIAGDEDMISTTHRLEGFRTGLLALELTETPGYVIHANYDGVGAREAVARLMTRPDPPTAIFCGNDTIAFEALAALADFGVRAPEDVSVIGVDDDPAALRIKPRLTTVRQSLNEIGGKATRLLISMINGKQVTPEDYLIESQLVVRDSAARVSPRNTPR
ncbi:MAG TPA: LacI family DNA-binding transcriptional regulator [Capsulimonadaceae bacterium]|jgi:DNA-binding LacI/PurR family transcriptional regulator